jgi:diaminopimelate decarboxylase
VSAPTAGQFPDEVLRQLAERFDTPLFVYDLDELERRVTGLRSVLPPAVDIAYAVKANPSLAVLATLAGLGLGADVASRGELAAALRAGIAPGRIVVTGPGKRDDELRRAVVAGVRAITVESPAELDRLERIAGEVVRDRPVPVLLRASAAALCAERSPADGADGVHGAETVVSIDDGAGKFGMDGGDLLACGRRALASDRLELLGLHAFARSNVLDADALADHAEATTRLAVGLARRLGTSLRLIDVGGGLGIPYANGDPTLDLDRLGRRLARLVATWSRDPILGEARLLLEPGRHLVGPIGVYLARAIDVKAVDGRHTIVLDGGIHHLMRPALVGREHRIRLIPRQPRRPGQARPTTVAGPLCTGLDILGRDVALAPAETGDLVEVRDAGAYGFTESMPLFLSHPMPAEVAVRGGRATEVRGRVEPEAWLDGQRLAGADGSTMVLATMASASSI